MSGITIETCGNCAAFRPLSKEMLEKYKDDPRVQEGDGTCTKGPYLQNPLVHPDDKCDPEKLLGFENWASGRASFDPNKSQWEPIKK